MNKVVFVNDGFDEIKNVQSKSVLMAPRVDETVMINDGEHVVVDVMWKYTDNNNIVYVVVG